MDSLNPADRSVTARLERLEEVSLFAEHRHDELHAALLDLSARLERVVRRVNELASRMDSIAGAPENARGPRDDGDETERVPGPPPAD